MGGFDWSMVEVFLTIAEAGSLSAAARALGTSQPTVGRQLREIEAALSTELFRRQPRGMALTAEGTALMEPARAMREAAAQFALVAAGSEDTLSGTVRITASVFFARYLLPRIVAGIREAEPEIALDIVASDQTENLLFREADIAIRMYRPTQMEVITRHIGDAHLGLFAARSYLQRMGRPDGPDDLARFDFVGYDRNTEIIEGFRASGWEVTRDFFPIRTDDNTVLWELVRAGCGLGIANRAFALEDPLVEEVPIGIPLPTLPVWLTAHSALRHTPRIRRVWDLLSEGLSDLVR